MANLTAHANSRVRHAYENLASRVRTMRLNGEKQIDRAVTIGFSSVACGGFGMINALYGEPPKNDPQGIPEHTILGVPSDLATGGLAAAAVFLGVAGKYEHMVLSVGSGALNAFTYRFGDEMGRKRKANKGGGGSTSTKGYASPWGPR